MKVKTSELTGPALDWAVAKCEGADYFCDNPTTWDADLPWESPFNYSTDPSHSWSIIEREGINLSVDYQDDALSDDMVQIGWKANLWNNSVPGTGGFLQWAYGPTSLVAAMRCFCMSRLGKEAEVPEELV